MPTTLTVVDAFTDRVSSGNPAAVCLLDRFPDDAWLQSVADELHLSETAFVVARDDGGYDLRWFTPTTEVDLCGHATLAAAFLLGGGRFHTRSGVLACRRLTDGRVRMELPSDPPATVAAPVGLLGALAASHAATATGTAATGTGTTTGTAATGTGTTTATVLAGRTDVMVVVDDAATVRSLVPDMTGLARVDARAVIVTGPGDRPGVDCVSRVFAPRVGIPEDPVTGSAHCTLAPYWAARTGRRDLVGEQASPRGGTVSMQLTGDTVAVGGRAVVASEVRLLTDPPSPADDGPGAEGRRRGTSA